MLDLEASLRREQRLFAEAHALLDRALDARPEGTAAARVLLIKAKTYEEEKGYVRAVATLREAAPLVEAAGDPRLTLVLRSNLLEPASANRICKRLGSSLMASSSAPRRHCCGTAADIGMAR
jgi:hypothetical protein